MKTELKTFQQTFKQIKMSEDFAEVSTFCDDLSRSGFIDYHYSLLKEKKISSLMHQHLRNKFLNHGEGEYFLLQKITKEKGSLKGDILQILGGYKYRSNKFLDQTAKHAREFIKTKSVDLRFRGIIVLGWVGEESDVEILADSMFNDYSDQNRGWGASALMQLFFHKPTIRNKVLQYLQKALETETSYFSMCCILQSIQVIAKKKWGLSARGRPEDESQEKIDSAKIKAQRFLIKYFAQL